MFSLLEDFVCHTPDLALGNSQAKSNNVVSPFLSDFCGALRFCDMIHVAMVCGGKEV